MELDERLGPERRVKRRQDFLRIQARGKKLRSKHFLLVSAPRNSTHAVLAQDLDSRIGVTVTKKVDKRAARRNRLRRRVKEVFRFQRHKLTAKVDIVVIALSGSVELDFDSIRRELGYLFRKSGLIVPKHQRKTNARHKRGNTLEVG